MSALFILKRQTSSVRTLAFAGVAAFAAITVAGCDAGAATGQLKPSGPAASSEAEFSADRLTGQPSVEPLDESIRDVDFVGREVRIGESEYTLASEAEYEAWEHSPGEAIAYLEGEPQYADLDGDGRLEAVTMVNLVDTHGSQHLYIWSWDDGEPTQLPTSAATGGGNPCGAPNIDDWHAADEELEVSTSVYDCDEGNQPSESFTVQLEYGHPVVVEPHYGSAARCDWLSSSESVEITGIVMPKAAPDHTAPDVGEWDEFDAVYADVPENADDSWVLAALARPDGAFDCGHVHVDDLG